MLEPTGARSTNFISNIKTKRFGKALVLCSMISALLATGACSQQDSSSLTQALSIDTSEITVSGLSSGGYMATQFHLSHADIVKGAGIIAAGPYNCARGSIATVFAECLNQAPEAYAAELMSPFSTNIATPEQLSDSRVWILHGTLDERIHANAANGLYKQYQSWLKPDSLVFVKDKPFAHLFPSDGLGGKCDVSESPFIGDCGFDAAGEMLQHILGPLNDKASVTDTDTLGTLYSLTQSDIADLSGASMAETAFAYLPNACIEGKTCKLHISFHGCNQAVGNVDDAFAKSTGLNQWAATNQLIVLYPQIEKSAMMPMNPQACWDWWGYTDENYANKDGVQIQAVRSMVDALAQSLSVIIANENLTQVNQAGLLPA